MVYMYRLPSYVSYGYPKTLNIHILAIILGQNKIGSDTVLSVPCSLVTTYWESTDLLALLCVMFSCVLSLSHMVSWVRFDTLLYRFLLFAFFLTFISMF